MPMIKRGNAEYTKFRVLISGRSNSGKTRSIETFDEEGKTLVIINCPGETGTRSLPLDSDTITSYIYETDSDKPLDAHSVEWSEDAIYTFNNTWKEIEKNKPDKAFIDGIHWLYSHMFNVISNGEYLSGVDMNINPSTGKVDPYRSAKLYNQAHQTFGQYLAAFYASPIPFIGVTVWEEWQAARTDLEKGGGIEARRYLWPALPGAMATSVVGRFDARLSALPHTECIHTNCKEAKENLLHYVWQFYPKNDVMGVGIKGLNVTQPMIRKPWIHQTYAALQNLLKKV